MIAIMMRQAVSLNINECKKKKQTEGEREQCGLCRTSAKCIMHDA